MGWHPGWPRGDREIPHRPAPVLARLCPPLSEINDIEHHCAVELYMAISGRLDVEIQHGDTHLGNVIRQPDGQLALIDLEFTAWR